MPQNAFPSPSPTLSADHGDADHGERTRIFPGLGALANLSRLGGCDSRFVFYPSRLLAKKGGWALAKRGTVAGVPLTREKTA